MEGRQGVLGSWGAFEGCWSVSERVSGACSRVFRGGGAQQGCLRGGGACLGCEGGCQASSGVCLSSAPLPNLPTDPPPPPCLSPQASVVNGMGGPVGRGSREVELEEVLERQRGELAQLRERLSLLCRQLAELEEALASAHRDLAKAQESNAKLQRDLKEVRTPPGPSPPPLQDRLAWLLPRLPTQGLPALAWALDLASFLPKPGSGLQCMVLPPNAYVHLSVP